MKRCFNSKHYITAEACTTRSIQINDFVRQQGSEPPDSLNNQASHLSRSFNFLLAMQSHRERMRKDELYLQGCRRQMSFAKIKVFLPAEQAIKPLCLTHVCLFFCTKQADPDRPLCHSLFPTALRMLAL